jgi:membrane protein YqaA with SNARE-associated domain
MSSRKSVVWVIYRLHYESFSFYRIHFNFRLAMASFFNRHEFTVNSRRGQTVEILIIAALGGIIILLEGTSMMAAFSKLYQIVFSSNIKFNLYGLFLNGLISSFLPIPTEISIAALLIGGVNSLIIVVILDIGSIIGAFLAYCLGFNSASIINQTRLRTIQLNRYVIRLKTFLRRYMWLGILLSPWIPIIGDYASVFAGITKYNFSTYLTLSIIGKTLKIIATVLLMSWIFHLIF